VQTQFNGAGEISSDLGASEAELKNYVSVQKAGLDRGCANARNCSQYPSADHGLFRPRFIEDGNARPGHRIVTAPRSRSIALGRTFDDRYQHQGNQVDCFWTGGDGQPNAESFPIDVLQKF
jgi:hypothetical protein